MKGFARYSQPIGVLAVVLLVVSCYLPWIYIGPLQASITGMHAPGTSFGKPGLLNIILGVLAAVFFLIPRIWAKRINIFVAALGMAWAARNFLLLPKCENGFCPEKQAGLFLLLISAIIIIICALLPDVQVKQAAQRQQAP
jgi:hypothetical protein